MANQKIESPLAKAWKRLKKNYPAMFSMVVIVITLALAIFAPVISPDKTTNANDQILELANERPGFSKDVLRVRKNRTIRKGFFLVGTDNPYTLVPINSYSIKNDYVFVDAYRGEQYSSRRDSFLMIDVVYPLSITDKNILASNGNISFNDYDEKGISTNLSDLAKIIEKKHIKRKSYKLGTDKFGRDILSRILNGLRVSLSVGFVAVFISLFIGIFLGATAGYFRNDSIKVSRASKIAAATVFAIAIGSLITGIYIKLPFIFALLAFVGAILLFQFALKAMIPSLKEKSDLAYDDFTMWLINVVWSIPTILLAMALSFSLGNWIESFWVIYIAVGLSMWVEVARIVRGQVMTVREMEYVQASRGLGFNNFRIIGRHILPNIVGPLMVIMAANFAAAILIEAGLSFIGIGVQPPKPSLGNMLSEYRNYLKVPGKAFLALAPGFAIMILVLAFNLIGNGLRDAFDVKGKDN